MAIRFPDAPRELVLVTEWLGKEGKEKASPALPLCERRFVKVAPRSNLKFDKFYYRV